MPQASEQIWSKSLKIEPIHKDALKDKSATEASQNSNNSIAFSIASFNILAESYLTPRSHTNLPAESANVVFHKESRRKLLCDTLTDLAKTFDILCVQELDFALRDEVFACLEKQGFGWVYAPRGGDVISSNDSIDALKSDVHVEKKAGTATGTATTRTNRKDRSNARSDGCATFYNCSKWKLVKHDVVNFDDLAEEDRPPLPNESIDGNNAAALLSSSSNNDSSLSASSNNSNGGLNGNGTIKEEKVTKKIKKKKKYDALSGIIASYRRRNTALIVAFEHIHMHPHPRPHPHPQSSASNVDVIVANTHLYWHPGYEYVKLSQAHYLVWRVKQFAMTLSSSSPPSSPSSLPKDENSKSEMMDEGNLHTPTVLICGDMNSKPNSAVHKYFTKGEIDARVVAPWHFHYDELEEQEELAKRMESLNVHSDDVAVAGEDADADTDQDPVVYSDDAEEDEHEYQSKSECIDGGTSEVENVDEKNNNLVGSLLEGYQDAPELPSYEHERKNEKDQQEDSEEAPTGDPPVRYLLDMTLNRLTRWLRILGVDATLETAEEEKLRTGKGEMILFDRCRKERRNLITTSKTLMTRRDCPPGTYLVKPSTLKTLEEALVDMLSLHGVTLYPKKFLTRCVVCNGKIHEVFDREEQKAIFDEFASPDLGEELDHVYKCNSCGQGYWWSSSPTSSASRVKDACSRLLTICLRGGVQIKGQPDFFAHVDYDGERLIGQTERLKALADGTGRGKGRIEEVLSWLKDKKLQNPYSLKSAYASEVDGESLPFTNVTSDFVGTLDYILFEDSKNELRQVGRLAVPTKFQTLNTTGVSGGHLLPSQNWPSDHLCIGAKFVLEARQYQSGASQRKGIQSAYAPPGIESNLMFQTKQSKGIQSAYVPPGFESQMMFQRKRSKGIKSAYVPPGVANKMMVQLSKKKSIQSAYVPPGVESQLLYKSNQSEERKSADVSEDTEEHLEPHPGCDCGCVPKVLSLFQMAELRKKARLKKQKEAELAKM